jgi:hypothetical protein
MFAKCDPSSWPRRYQMFRVIHFPFKLGPSVLLPRLFWIAYLNITLFWIPPFAWRDWQRNIIKMEHFYNHKADIGNQCCNLSAVTMGTAGTDGPKRPQAGRLDSLLHWDCTLLVRAVDGDNLVQESGKSFPQGGPRILAAAEPRETL